VGTPREKLPETGKENGKSGGEFFFLATRYGVEVKEEKTAVITKV